MWIVRSMQEKVSLNAYRQLENILKTLSNHDAPATFFITGEMAQKHPRIPQMILRNEHEIASHGYSHKSYLRATFTEAEKEIADSIKTLSKFGEIRGFRAPFLRRSKATYLACEKLGLSYDSSEHGLTKYCPNGSKLVVLPIVPPSDTHGLDLMHLKAGDLVAKWLRQSKKSNGAAVCMHAWRIGQRKYVETILEPLLKSNLAFVKAYELLNKDGIALTFDVEYISLSDSLLRSWTPASRKRTKEVQQQTASFRS